MGTGHRAIWEMLQRRVAINISGVPIKENKYLDSKWPDQRWDLESLMLLWFISGEKKKEKRKKRRKEPKYLAAKK